MGYVEQVSVTSVFAVMSLAIAPAGPAGDPFDTDCSAVTRKVVRQEDGRAFNAQFRIRCSFSVTSIHLYSSKPLRRMDGTPVLQGERSFESLTCAKRRRRGVCSGGGLKAGTRVVGSFAVAGDPCDEPRMSVRLVIRGGVDGPPGAPVPAIGLRNEKEVAGPRGCD